MNEKESQFGTPYDDVFRTLLNDCAPLVIPVVNELFGESYSGSEKITFSPNEHFLNQQDGEERKVITDSCFTIEGDVPKKYLFECQSTPDNSMLVRIFEYSSQIALDSSTLEGNTLKVEFPHCGILFLRSREKSPDEMHMEFITPNGSVTMDVAVMKLQTYSLGEILEKRLTFLTPFYLFRVEKDLGEYNTDEEKRSALIADYIAISDYLNDQLKGELLDLCQAKIIRELTMKVVRNLARKYENVVEGVKNVMGGRILETEAKTIYRQGLQKGIQEGRQEGQFEAWIQSAKSLMQAAGWTASQAVEKMGIPQADSTQVLKRLKE